MAQGAGRITCGKCGANNFDTVTSCWKCGAALAAPATAPPPRMAPPPPMAPRQAPPRQDGFAAAAQSAAYQVGAAAGLAGNPTTSDRAAIWLGLLFPYFGIAIGLAFMMCDDRRRQEVGRSCVIWSAISTAIHLVLFAISIGSMVPMLGALLGGAKGLHPGGMPTLPGSGIPGGLGGDQQP